MKFYLLRHGETLWNTLGRFQGQVDIPLNDNGVHLATVLGERIRNLPVDVCYSSPLLRAHETAALALKGRDIPIIDDKRLLEMAFGEMEGKYCAGPKREVPEDFMDAFWNRPFEFQPMSGGERITDLLDRVGDFLKSILADEALQGKNIMISSHGVTARGLLYHMVKPEREADFWRTVVPPNCSITIVDYTDGRFTIEALDHIFYDQKDVVDYYAE